VPTHRKVIERNSLTLREGILLLLLHVLLLIHLLLLVLGFGLVLEGGYGGNGHMRGPVETGQSDRPITKGA
jgi:hypothetical protein